MPTVEEKWRSLVSRLSALTESAKIEWSESPEQGVTASFSNFSVELRLYGEDDGKQKTLDVLVRIYDSAGEVIDQFYDVDAGASLGASEGLEFYKKLSELYKVAIRQAKGSDLAVDELLRELSQLG